MQRATTASSCLLVVHSPVLSFFVDESRRKAGKVAPINAMGVNETERAREKRKSERELSVTATAAAAAAAGAATTTTY